MNTISIFDFEKLPVRVVMIDGQPWFIGKDVATVLGYNDTPKAIAAHCKYAKSLNLFKVGDLPTFSEINKLHPQTLLIPESDIYRLVMRSKLPAAEHFERFVMEELLPQIRQYGYYINPELTKSQEEQLVEEVATKYDRRFIDLKRRELIDKIVTYFSAYNYTKRQVNALLSSTYNSIHVAIHQKLATQIVFEKYKQGITRDSLVSVNTSHEGKIFKSDFFSAINYYTLEDLEQFGKYFEIILLTAVSTINNKNIPCTPQLLIETIKNDCKRIVQQFSGLDIGTKLENVNREELNKAIQYAYDQHFILSEEERDEVIRELEVNIGRIFTV